MSESAFGTFRTSRPVAPTRLLGGLGLALSSILWTPVEPAGDGTTASLVKVFDNTDDPSLTIGSDGLPIISHNDSGGNLFVTHCEDPACNTSVTTNVDSGDAHDDPTKWDDVGYYSSITVGSDGLPVISHWNEPQGALRITHCEDVACLSASSVDVDAGGWESSIAIGSDGLPIISHHDFTLPDLRVTHCEDLACTAVTSTVLGVGAAGIGSHIVIGSDGLPNIAYDGQGGAAGLAHCDDILCLTRTTPISDSDGPLIGPMALGHDGLLIIAARVSSFPGASDELVVTRCEDPACSRWSSSILGGGRRPGAIAIGSDGLPVIAGYTGPSATTLTMTHCLDPACTVVTSVDVTSDPPASARIMAVAPDGQPVIAGHPRMGGGLWVWKLSSWPPTAPPITTATTTSTTATPTTQLATTTVSLPATTMTVEDGTLPTTGLLTDGTTMAAILVAIGLVLATVARREAR